MSSESASDPAVRRTVVRRRPSTGLVISLSILIGAVLMSVIGPAMLRVDPLAQDIRHRLAPPAAEVATSMGRDQLGRSVLGRVVASGRVSLLIAGAAVALSAMIGSAAGLLAGFYRGWVDSVIVRAIEVQMAFPAILLALAIVGVFGSGVLTLIVVFAITGWPVYARTVRSSALVLGSSEMVEAGRAIGQRTWILLSRYILANSVSPVMVILAFDIGRVILSEAALSFLGLGVQPPLPTWGNMIAEGRNYINTAWWLITFPGLAIVLIVFGCSLLADALRDRWDPRA